MKEGVSITFDLHLRPDVATGFKAAGQSILQDTVTFAGFQHIRVVQHEADVNRLRFIERWNSLDAYHRYIAWRTETGAIEAFKQIADHTETHFWPHLIAKKNTPEPIADGDGITVTMALTLKQEFLELFLVTDGLFDLAASCPGFRSIYLVQHQDAPTRLLFIQRWNSADDYRHYFNLQKDKGAIEQLFRSLSP